MLTFANLRIAFVSSSNCNSVFHLFLFEELQLEEVPRGAGGLGRVRGWKEEVVVGGLGEELQVAGQEGGRHLRAEVHQQVRAARPVADPDTLSIDIYI